MGIRTGDVVRVPLNWLREYVDVTMPVEELAHRLSMAGAEVDEIVNTGGEWEGVSVGLVTEIAPHPNADRLRLATVDVGDGAPQTVVCGAPNVAEGQHIAFAREGAMMVDAHSGDLKKLRKSKIRGVESAGMVCSERELGMSDEHEGILVLDDRLADGTALGTPLRDVLGEWVLDIASTPNRPDHNSILGIAREVAALTGETVREPDASYETSGPAVEVRTSVEIMDADLCPRYTAAVIEGLTVQPSPSWMQEALVAAGQRPINNVVDVTNYVMLEMGQPLHAFDFEKLGGGRIIVRRAAEGESIRLIDDSTHKLTTENLVIADADQAVAVAGVMGSGDSEVSESTTLVLLEAATFVGPNNRRTAAALKKRTEASQRFEKGLSVDLAMAASKRAMKLLLEAGGGKADAGHVDAFPGDGATVLVEMPRARLTQVLGVEVDEARVVAILESLGFVVRTSEAAYSVDVPYWRSDVRIADDVVEEVARIIGYDNLPSVALSGAVPDPEPQPLLLRREAIRDALAAAGFREVINYSATSATTRALAPSGPSSPADERTALRLLNPMSSERDELRTSLRAGVLQNFGANVRQQRGPLGLFEVGKVFWPREGDLPEERLQLVAVYGGTVGGDAHQAETRPVDFFDAKGVAEGLGASLRMALTFDQAQAADGSLVEGASAVVNAVATADGEALGVLGQVRPDVAARFDIEGPLFLLELDVTALSALPEASTTVGSLSRFPSVEEDLAIVVDDEIPAATVAALLTRQKLVESVALFDVYRGEQIEVGKKSLAYAVSYRAADRTLTEKDVTRVRRGIVKQLERELGASLREG